MRQSLMWPQSPPSQSKAMPAAKRRQAGAAFARQLVRSTVLSVQTSTLDASAD